MIGSWWIFWIRFSKLSTSISKTVRFIKGLCRGNDSIGSLTGKKIWPWMRVCVKSIGYMKSTISCSKSKLPKSSICCRNYYSVFTNKLFFFWQVFEGIFENFQPKMSATAKFKPAVRTFWSPEKLVGNIWALQSQALRLYSHWKNKKWILICEK